MARSNAVTEKTKNTYILSILSSLWLTLRNNLPPIIVALTAYRYGLSTGVLLLNSSSNFFDKPTQVVLAVFVQAYNRFGLQKDLYRSRHPRAAVSFSLLDFL